MSEKFKKTILEILGVVAVAAGTNVAMSKLDKRGVGEGFTNERAELLDELCRMEPDEKDNLLRRHREAINAHQEHRFVQLLCGVHQDPQEGRRPTLIHLNNMDDEEFEQMLSLLDDSMFRRVDAAAGRARPYVQQLAERIRSGRIE